MITPLPAAWPEKPGSATLPFFGVVPAIVNEQGEARRMIRTRAALHGGVELAHDDSQLQRQGRQSSASIAGAVSALRRHASAGAAGVSTQSVSCHAQADAFPLWTSADVSGGALDVWDSVSEATDAPPLSDDVVPAFIEQPFVQDFITGSHLQQLSSSAAVT